MISIMTDTGDGKTDKKYPRIGYTNPLATFTGKLVTSSRGVRPVVNLKKNLKIIGGSGTAEEPYTF